MMTMMNQFRISDKFISSDLSFPTVISNFLMWEN